MINLTHVLVNGLPPHTAPCDKPFHGPQDWRRPDYCPRCLCLQFLDTLASDLDKVVKLGQSLKDGIEDMAGLPYPYTIPNTIGNLSVKIVNDMRQEFLTNYGGWGSKENNAHKYVKESMRKAGEALLQRKEVGIKMLEKMEQLVIGIRTFLDQELQPE